MELRIGKGGFFNLQPANGWFLIFGFVLFVALCLLTGLSRILNVLFPVGSLVVAIVLYFRYPLLYLGFVWWVWFLHALVRRLVDYRSGFNDPSLILLAPFLVTLVSIITLIRYPPTKQDGLPFALVFASIFYAYIIGLINGIPFKVTSDFLTWLSPLAFSYHIFINWQDYPKYRQNTQIIFLISALVTGIYGVFQYIVAPEWDKFWLIQTEMISAGKPAPFEIRVWSTMNSPGVFAPTMMAALLMLLINISPLSLPATAVGYLTFLLSLVRSAWVGWMIGLLTLTASLKPKLQMRLVLIVVIATLCVVPLVNMEPFADIIHTRLETLSDLTNDGSGAGRIEIYEDIIGLALVNFLGAGIGNTGSYDSGILMIAMTLGWFGDIPYLGGMVFMFIRVARCPHLSSDPFARAAQAIALGMVTQLAFGPVMYGLPGMILWAFLSMALAGEKYYTWQQHSYSLKHYSNSP